MPPIKERLLQEAEVERREFMLALANKITKSIDSITLEDVDVNNIDEVRKGLRLELARAINPLIKGINSLISTTSKNKPITKVSVDNLKDFPEELKVSNLQELAPFFDKLADSLSESLSIDIQAPDVIVPEQPAPIVNVPETQISVPEVNLGPLQDRLKQIGQSVKALQNNSAKKPLAVRLANGTKFIDQLEKVVTATNDTLEGATQAFASFPGAMQLRSKSGPPVNPATLESTDLRKGALSHQFLSATDSSAQFTLTSGTKQVDIQNNGSKIVYIGGSGVTSASYAYQIVPRQILPLGKVADSFSFYYICASSQTTSIGVAEYA